MRKTGTISLIYLSMACLLGGLAGCSTLKNIDLNSSDINQAEPGVAAVVQEGSEEAVGEGFIEINDKEPPLISSQEIIRLTYPPVDAGSDSRAVSNNVSDWPEMRYLGEEATVGSLPGYERVSVTPQEIRIVQGEYIPVSYSPVLDMIRPEPEGAPRGWGGRLDKPVLFIPPNASLVMVRIETDPSPGRWMGQDSYPGTGTGSTFLCPEENINSYDYIPTKFWISYPDLGESNLLIGSYEYWFGEYQGVGYECPGSGWLYFYIPEITIDPGLLWLEYIGGSGLNQLAFWTLIERP